MRALSPAALIVCRGSNGSVGLAPGGANPARQGVAEVGR
jgi:hypothetical protein